MEVITIITIRKASCMNFIMGIDNSLSPNKTRIKTSRIFFIISKTSIVIETQIKVKII